VLKSSKTMHKIIPLTASLKSEICIPGDKSITHRSVMFASLASGESHIQTNALGRDNFATIRIFWQLGVSLRLVLSPAMMELAVSEGLSEVSTPHDGEECHLYVEGRGAWHLKKPSGVLDCGNSGTTARLICGILAHTDFTSVLTGDHSLQKRPFARISDPLGSMGVAFSGGSMPLEVSGVRVRAGGKILPRQFELKKASAQVKSAILLAGLHAEGTTRVIEPVTSRDHTERMLRAMGVPLRTANLPDGRYQVEIDGVPSGALSPLVCKVPGDFSSAMFFIVAGIINRHSGVTIRNVGMNPTRTGALEILKRMGANFEVVQRSEQGGEPVADIVVHSSELRGITIDETDVARAIDEIPVISVAAVFAEGRTEIRGAEELRVKESDRISMTLEVLRSFGASVEEYQDGLGISGDPHRTSFKNDQSPEDAPWKHCGDHRISMCAAILQFTLGFDASIFDFPAVETSFPTFSECFE
jgi:3-phosphoshikimate 1-carboxyvinyltransferase